MSLLIYARLCGSNARRFGGLLALCALVSAVEVPAGAFAGDESPLARPPAEACPTTLRLESSNGADYSTMFESTQKETASFTIRMFADGTDYIVNLPNVPITKPYEDFHGRDRYRSDPIEVHVPGELPIAAAVKAIFPSEGVTCATEDVNVEPFGSFYKVKEREARAETDRSANLPPSNVVTSFIAAPAGESTFPCEEPFRRAWVKDIVQPQLPDGVLIHADGTAYIDVSLDSSGNVTGTSVERSSGNKDLDTAAIFAAANSRYNAAIFACAPQASHYVFRSLFLE